MEASNRPNRMHAMPNVAAEAFANQIKQSDLSSSPAKSSLFTNEQSLVTVFGMPMELRQNSP